MNNQPGQAAQGRYKATSYYLQLSPESISTIGPFAMKKQSNFLLGIKLAGKQISKIDKPFTYDDFGKHKFTDDDKLDTQIFDSQTSLEWEILKQDEQKKQYEEEASGQIDIKELISHLSPNKNCNCYDSPLLEKTLTKGSKQIYRLSFKAHIESPARPEHI